MDCDFFNHFQDTDGSALHSAFEKTATSAGMVVQSLAIPYNSGLDSSEIQEAMVALQQSHYRYILTVVNERHLEAIFTVGLQYNVVGPDYMYVLPGIDTTSRLMTQAGMYSRFLDSDLIVEYVH
jgi:hypothetical protein